MLPRMSCRALAGAGLSVGGFLLEAFCYRLNEVFDVCFAMRIG